MSSLMKSLVGPPYPYLKNRGMRRPSPQIISRSWQRQNRRKELLMATLLLWFGVVCSLILALCFVFFALQGHGDRVNLRLTLIAIVTIMAIAVFWYHSPPLSVHFLVPALIVRMLHMLQQLVEAIGT